MARANALNRDPQPLTGLRQPARTPADLVDDEFLADIGWNPSTCVFTLPEHHPKLGWVICPVANCTAAAGMGEKGLCPCCGTRWRGLPEPVDLATFIERPRRLEQLPPVRATTGRLDLSGFPDVLRDQLLAVISLEKESGRHQLGVLLRHAVRWVRSNHITTLDDPQFVAIVNGDRGGLPAFRRSAYNRLQLALTRPEDEVGKDEWDLRVFGYPRGRLNFLGGGQGNNRGTTRISPLLTQQWLRQTAKEFTYQCLLPRQLSHRTMSTYLQAFGHLSASLAERLDGGHEPAALSRADLVNHLVRLNALERAGAMANLDHHRMIVYLRRALHEVVALGLTDPGEPAEGLPRTFAFRQADAVKLNRVLAEDDVGDALPDVVLEQLLAPESLALLEKRSLVGAQVRRMIQVIADVGRRPSEVVDLHWDCLAYEESVDALGETRRSPVLIYDMPKTGWVRRRLPIHASTAQLIHDQQQYVRDKFPDTPPAELALWPRNMRNPRGTERPARNHLTQVMTRWLDDLPELHGPDLDVHGAPVPFPRGRVFPYAFRHTFAQRHADAGTPVEVLKELMGHEVITSTQAYYRVTARRKRDAVRLVAPFQVDRTGTRTRPDMNRLLPSEGLRESVGALSIPFGVCVEPSNVRSHGRSCSFRYQCLGCSHFRTDPSYLPELRSYLSRRLADLEKLRAGTDEVTAWAAEAATPRDEEIDATRALIRVCEQQLDDMSPVERADVDAAIAQMRRARGDLDEVLPPSLTGSARQPTPVLFPTIGVRVGVGQP